VAIGPIRHELRILYEESTTRLEREERHKQKPHPGGFISLLGSILASVAGRRELEPRARQLGASRNFELNLIQDTPTEL